MKEIIENDMKCGLTNVKQMVEIVPNKNGVGFVFYLDGKEFFVIYEKLSNKNIIDFQNVFNNAYSHGFSKATEFIMNNKRESKPTREVIIQAFLSGKKFSDGEQFAPNASLDIANKWYDENFK